MRTIHAAVLSLFLATSAAAQIANVRFLPPAPDSRTPVTARVGGIWPNGVPPGCGAATVTGFTVVVALDCASSSGPAVVSPIQRDVFIGTLSAGVYDVEVTIPFNFSSPAAPPTPMTIAQGKLIVQEASPAFTVSPNTGSPGDTIRLQGPALRCPDNVACITPIVRFGNQNANVLRIENDTYDVRVPPGSGTVDISVELLQNVRRVAAFQFIDVQKPPSPEFYTPVLFPVLFSATGAFGSLWDTEVSARNENAYHFTSPYETPFENWCFICDPRPFPGLPPHESGTIRASASLHNLPLGQLSYIQRDAAPKVHFGLLIRDLSRQREALGAEVPVVRENEFFDSASFSLLNVPADNRFRTGLRVYSIERDVRVQMRVRPMNAPDPLVTAALVLSRPGNLPYEHSAIFIGDLVAAYPQLAGHGPLRIEIEPLLPGAIRIWGFATVTNNDAQHVTVISPQ
jgi:hypothetical protein